MIKVIIPTVILTSLWSISAKSSNDILQNVLKMPLIVSILDILSLINSTAARYIYFVIEEKSQFLYLSGLWLEADAFFKEFVDNRVNIFLAYA